MGGDFNVLGLGCYKFNLGHTEDFIRFILATVFFGT